MEKSSTPGRSALGSWDEGLNNGYVQGRTLNLPEGLEWDIIGIDSGYHIDRMGYRKLTMLDMYYNMYIYSNAPRKMETQLTTDLEVFLLSYLLRDYYIYIDILLYIQSYII